MVYQLYGNMLLGQQEDVSTGLIYLRARYYSAELKAFTAYDVWPGADRRPQSLNHYAYTEGNPKTSKLYS